MLKRSWAVIDTERLRENCRICASLLDGGRQMMAVVKADAYGHGDRRTAPVFQDAGVRHFAVSNIHEAEALREAGITGRILILGYTPPECAEELLRYDVTQALLSEGYARELAGRGIAAEFAVDTGMNRIGIDADDPARCEEIIRSYAPQFRLQGLFTHLCAADDPAEDDFTRGQIRRFRNVCARVEDLGLPYRHCLNSAGGLFYAGEGELVRFGIVLYGLKPDRANALPDGIKPALSWKTVAAMVKTVRAGESVGYGRAYRAEKDVRIATLPTGYADGYPRALSGRGSVWIRGARAGVVGRVCMDQMMVDVTDIPDVREGDEVTLLGDEYTADDMARDAGTIGYEIVCGISKRVPRMYI